MQFLNYLLYALTVLPLVALWVFVGSDRRVTLGLMGARLVAFTIVTVQFLLVVLLMWVPPLNWFPWLQGAQMAVTFAVLGFNWKRLTLMSRLGDGLHRWEVADLHWLFEFVQSARHRPWWLPYRLLWLMPNRKYRKLELWLGQSGALFGLLQIGEARNRDLSIPLELRGVWAAEGLFVEAINSAGLQAGLRGDEVVRLCLPIEKP